MWKPGDIFIFEDRHDECLIGKIVFCPPRPVGHKEIFWNVELFASGSRRGLSPFVVLSYGLVKHKIRKVTGGEAKFYEMFWELTDD